MNLGDVTNHRAEDVLLAAAQAVNDTHSSAPGARCDQRPGAVSVTTAPAPDRWRRGRRDPFHDGPLDVVVEHPTGLFTVSLEVDTSSGTPDVRRAALLRTARLLMRGEVMVPASVWGGA
jgi:4-oxalomesaconate tautomerase